MTTSISTGVEPFRCDRCPSSKTRNGTLTDLCENCRNLTEDRRTAVFDQMYEHAVKASYIAKSSKGGKAGGKGRPRQLDSLGVDGVSQAIGDERLRDRMCKQFNIEKYKHSQIMKLRKQNRAMWQLVYSGESTLKQAQAIDREEKRQQQIGDALKTHGQDGHGILTGDFLDVLPPVLKPSSVDLILTDPPWADLAAYEKVAEFAQTYLKPGGFCAVQLGTAFLPPVVDLMRKFLEYIWQPITTLEGDHARIWDRNLTSGYKSTLVFAKRPVEWKKHPFWHDCLKGSGQDKTHHEWGQHYEEYVYYIQRWTLPGQLVCDPCVGGGAVPVACKTLARPFIGAERNPGVAAKARARLDAWICEGGTQAMPQNG
jgi:hypothetical protein